MAQYDGSIRIITEISTEMAKKSLGTLSNMITLTAKEISSLRSKMDALKGQKFYTDDYKKLQSDLTEAEKKLADYSSLMQSSSIKNENQQKAVNKQIEKYEDEIESIKGKMQALEDVGKAFTLGSDTTEYANYERQLQYEQAALREVTKQYLALENLNDPYGRLTQSLNELNKKLINIARIMMTVKQSFSSSDVNVSGYEKLESSLGELGGIAIRAAETVKNAFATLTQGPVAVIHSLSSGLMNMANTVNSAIGAVLGSGLEKFGEGIGAVLEKLRQLASGIGSGISSALDVAKEKLAGFAGSVINIILHPFQTLKNVATTTLAGIANIIKGVLGSALEGLKNRAAGLAATIINGIVHPFKTLQSVAKKAFNAIRSGISVVKKMGKAFSSIAGAAKKAFSVITSGTKKSSGLFSTFSSRLKGIALSLLIFNWISKGFNAMISGMKKGFENLAGYSDSYAQNVQNMKNAMSTLGNQFAAAFAPIVQMVIPWLTQLINTISKAMTYVAQFFAVLSGKSTFTKAKQVQDAYNKSLGGTAKAADKARGALAKFDDLDVLERQGDTSGGGGANETSPSDMFEEIEIEDEWENISDWFREMWENSDFYELGNLLGAKLAEALSSINWGPIKEAVVGIAKSIGTLINGFVETDNLGASIGQTIGNAISTGISGINAFLDNTHWDSVGVFIGEALNGLVNAISWEDIGHFFAEKWNAIFSVIGEAARTFEWSNFGLELSNGINTAISDFDWAESGARLGDLVKGILDTIITFFENTNWQELGNNVATFIGSIDWTGLFEKLSQGIGAALGGLAAFLWGLIEEAWNSVVAWWQETAFEDGKFIPEKLFDGILEVLSNIGTWIKEHIAIPFLDGIAKAFGLDADGEELFEIGANIVSGFLNGIVDMVKSIGSWIDEHIFQPFINGFKKVFGIHSPSTVMAEIGGYIISGLLQGLKNTIGSVLEWLKNIPTWFKEKFVQAYEYAKSAFSGIGNFFLGVWEGIKKPFANIAGWFKDKFSAAWQAVKNVFSAGGKIFDGIKEGILNGLKAVINALIKGINKVIAIPFNGINFALETIKGVNILGFTPFDWISTIDVPQIPLLATGSVIRGGNPFMAILGDQPAGQTNVEAPLATIEQAVENVMSRRGYNNERIPVNINLTWDGETFARLSISDILSELGRQGFNVDVLGVT